MSLDFSFCIFGPRRGAINKRLRANWSERIVTVVAASIAVLIVAVIAVLMGMA